MSYFVVGDVHGCSEQLRALLAQNNLYRDRQAVFLGDYVDVGSDSRGVIDQLIGFLKHNPDSVFLEGNHESALKSFLQTGDFASYVEVGGLATIKSYCRDVYGNVHTLPFGKRCPPRIASSLVKLSPDVFRNVPLFILACWLFAKRTT